MLRPVAVPLALALLLPLAGCGGADSPEGASPEAQQIALGARVYRQQCVTCHQASGRGVPGAYPTLHGTRWTEGDAGRLIRLVLHGMEGPVEVKGKTYDQRMQPRGYLTDEQVAAVLTYVRQDFGNDAAPVASQEVARVRAATSGRRQPWTPEALWKATGIPEAPQQPPSEAGGGQAVDEP